MKGWSIGLGIAWFIIGIIHLVMGDITRISYGCIWSVALMYIVLDIIKEIDKNAN